MFNLTTFKSWHHHLRGRQGTSLLPFLSSVKASNRNTDLLGLLWGQMSEALGTPFDEFTPPQQPYCPMLSSNWQDQEGGWRPHQVGFHGATEA